MEFSRKDLTLKDRIRLFDEEKAVFLGYGLDLKKYYDDILSEDEEVEVWLTPKERAGHTLIIGTTGSGKTVFMSNLVKGDILSGNRLVYVDPKGDKELLQHAISYAKMAGRFKRGTFQLLSPLYLDYSVRLNPLWGLEPDEAAVVLGSSIPEGREPFFKRVSFMTLLAIFLSLSTQLKEGEYPSILEVSQFFSMKGIESLLKMVTEILEEVAHTSDEKLMRYGQDARLVLSHLADTGEDYFAKISMTLKSEIDILVTGSLGECIGRAKDNILVEKLLNDEDVIFIAYLGALRYGDELVGRGARMIFSSLQRLAGKMYQKFEKFDPPLAVYGDEAKNLFYDGIEDLFNKVRGANIMLTFATQSLGDIAAALGVDKMLSIIGNTNIQCFMRATDKVTMDFVEHTSEEVFVYRPNLLQHTLGLNQMRTKAVKGAQLKQLRTGSFYSTVYGKWYRLYSPYEPPERPIDLKQVFGFSPEEAS